MATKWRGIAPSSKMQSSTARLLLHELQQIAPDYIDSPQLLSLFDTAVSSVIDEWENRIKEQENPVTIDNSRQFWDDLNISGLDALKDDACINSMVSLSSLGSKQNELTISQDLELFLKGVSCLNNAKITGRETAFLRIQSISRDWVERWYSNCLPSIVNKEKASFDTITEYESILDKMPLPMADNLSRQIGLLHTKAANTRAGTGVSALISLLHIERAKQLCKDIPTDQIRNLQNRAIASIRMGEKLEAFLAIDSNPSINPQLYDLVRTALMVGIQNRTQSYFSWHFLPPGKTGVSNEINIESIDFQYPSYDSLRTIISEYFSHTESIPNPHKTYLESMLTYAKTDLDFAENNYDNAVRAYNLYPTQYGLMNANNAYNNYVVKLNTYNEYVRQYNACPSTVERPVYMPYSFREGTIYYGWRIKINYVIEGQSGSATGTSMESCFVRVGSRYNDKNSSYRRDIDPNFTISLDRTIGHLIFTINEICDQMKSSIAEAVPLKYISGLSDREINTAKWLLNPWGSDIDTERQNGIPEWILNSVSSLDFAEIEYKPTEIYIPWLQDHPKIPLDTTYAAKWYNGLIGEIVAIRSDSSRTISTGAVISADGLILTCAHGLGGEELRVIFKNGILAGNYNAEIVFVNERSDVALIRASGLKTRRWIEVRLDGKPRKGEAIVAIGNPTLPDGSISVEAISKGIVSNPESDFYGIPRMVADITIASGSSGGPLISLIDGKIIGVVIAVADSEIAYEPGHRSASGAVCLAAPSCRLKEWLGLRTSK